MIKLLLKSCNNIVLKHNQLLMLLILLLYSYTAYKSTGFHQPDEHFQIIEFANYKLGETKASDLSWEYGAKIRPSFQPGVAYVIFSWMDQFNIKDLFVKTFVLREITALLAILAISLFIKSNKDTINSTHYGLYVILSYFLWFIPYVSVRFSSEAWSGIFLLFALYYLKKTGSKAGSNLILGIIFGLSILFRYQSLIFVSAIFAWLFFVQKSTLKSLIEISTGISMILFLGFLLDIWFYEKPVFTLYNYFEANIIKDVASTFGVSPWYEYLWYMFHSSSYIIGFGIIISLIIVFLKNKKDLIFWTVVPFIFIHSLIPHKEMRFLFPLVFLCPYILIYAFQNLKITTRLQINFQNIYVLAFCFVNIAGLLVIATKSSGNAKQGIGDFMHQKYPSDLVHVIYIGANSPHNDWPFSRNTFFKYPNIRITNKHSIWENNFEQAFDPNMDNLLMLSNDDITGPRATERLKELGFRFVAQTIPIYGQLAIKFYDPENNDNIQIYKLLKDSD